MQFTDRDKEIITFIARHSYSKADCQVYGDGDKSNL